MERYLKDKTIFFGHVRKSIWRVHIGSQYQDSGDTIEAPFTCLHGLSTTKAGRSNLKHC